MAIVTKKHTIETMTTFHTGSKDTPHGVELLFRSPARLCAWIEQDRARLRTASARHFRVSDGKLAPVPAPNPYPVAKPLVDPKDIVYTNGIADGWATALKKLKEAK